MHEHVEHQVWLIYQIVDRAARLSDELLDGPIEVSVEGIASMRSRLAEAGSTFVGHRRCSRTAA